MLHYLFYITAIRLFSIVCEIISIISPQTICLYILQNIFLLLREVRIPPGGKTDALVETTITWALPGKTVSTTGIDPDQIVAAVFATEKMLNLLLPGAPQDKTEE